MCSQNIINKRLNLILKMKNLKVLLVAFLTILAVSCSNAPAVEEAVEATTVDTTIVNDTVVAVVDSVAVAVKK